MAGPIVGWMGWVWVVVAPFVACLAALCLRTRTVGASYAGLARGPGAEGTRDLLLGMWYGVVCVDGPAWLVQAAYSS